MTSTGMHGNRPTVTVLGATGLLGSAVTRALAARPVRLRVVGRRECTPPEGCAADVAVHTADFAVPGQVAECVAGSDAVVHLVADTARWRVADRDPASAQVNAGVMREVVDAAAREGTPPVVVFAGTLSQPGSVSRGEPDGAGQDSPHSPLPPFISQKQDAEQLLLTAAEEGRLRGASLRLPMLTSDRPGDRGLLPAMASRALAGEALPVWGDGLACRDLLHVADAAAAFEAALDCADRLAGRFWTVGTGVGTPLRDVLARVAAEVAAHTDREPVPVVPTEPAEATAADLADLVADPSAFQAATGWTPRHGLDETVRRLVAALSA